MLRSNAFWIFKLVAAFEFIDDTDEASVRLILWLVLVGGVRVGDVDDGDMLTRLARPGDIFSVWWLLLFTLIIDDVNVCFGTAVLAVVDDEDDDDAAKEDGEVCADEDDTGDSDEFVILELEENDVVKEALECFWVDVSWWWMDEKFLEAGSNAFETMSFCVSWFDFCAFFN